MKKKLTSLREYIRPTMRTCEMMPETIVAVSTNMGGTGDDEPVIDDEDDELVKNQMLDDYNVWDTTW